jgi:hypothetical protein
MGFEEFPEPDIVAPRMKGNKVSSGDNRAYRSEGPLS